MYRKYIKLTFIINIPCEFKKEINYMYKGILARVNWFTGKITGKHDIIIPRLIMYIFCITIVNTYWTYVTMRLITNERYMFPKNNGQGHLK